MSSFYSNNSKVRVEPNYQSKKKSQPEQNVDDQSIIGCYILTMAKHRYLLPASCTIEVIHLRTACYHDDISNNSKTKVVSKYRTQHYNVGFIVWRDMELALYDIKRRDIESLCRLKYAVVMKIITPCYQEVAKCFALIIDEEPQVYRLSPQVQPTFQPSNIEFSIHQHITPIQLEQTHLLDLSQLEHSLLGS